MFYTDVGNWTVEISWWFLYKFVFFTKYNFCKQKSNKKGLIYVIRHFFENIFWLLTFVFKNKDNNYSIIAIH